MSSVTNTLPSHAVRRRRYFYGPAETCSIVFAGTLAECREYIRSEEAAVCYLSHNESGRPTLRVVRTASLRESALRDVHHLLMFCS